MPSCREQAAQVRSLIPAEVELVAISKFHPAQKVQQAYEAGLRHFGESRANEFVAKAQELPHDIVWHFIGHLQTNKVRQILPHVSVIQSVDSLKLLKLIDAEAVRINRRIDVLLQVHVAREETKFGFSPEEIRELITPELIATLKGANIIGVMAMASNVDDNAVISRDFDEARRVFEELKAGVMAEKPDFRELSMGMSHDWPIAVEHGSTMVRIGTAIFGEREY